MSIVEQINKGLTMEQETISAPNGTKFLKPPFDCKLYEEVEEAVFGKANTGTLCKWDAITGECINTTAPKPSQLNLTPAPKLWYEDLGKGKLCWVWDADGNKLVVNVVKHYLKEAYPYESEEEAYTDAQPLTQEEALEYIVKDNK